MDRITWAFNRVNWTLYRDDSGLWMAFSSTSESHKTKDKKNMESWLTDRGLRTNEIESLIFDVEKNGEAAITVSHLHERRD
jgi:hypothetical protein